MYQMFQQHLGENFTESPGVAKYRLLDMYCKCTEPDMKEAILREFCVPNNFWENRSQCYADFSDHSSWHPLAIYLAD